MANWQVISLDTTTPQLRAPGTGDGYSFNSGSTQLGVWTTTGLGIGTASPGAKLQVIGNTKVGTGAASNSATFMVNNLNATATGIQLFQDGQESWIMGLPASSTALTWANSGSEKMRLDTVGNLGIGTASPAYQLDLQGGTTNNTRVRLLRGTDDAYQFMTLGWDRIQVHRANVSLSSPQTAFSFNQVGSDGTRTAMIIDSSGNVGIGTTSPAQRLDVTGAVNSVQARFGNVAGRGLTIGTTTNSGTNDAAVVFNAPTTEGAFFFQTVSDTKMTLSTSGNLGLGNSTVSTTIGRNLTINGTNAGTNSGIVLQSATTERGYVYASDTQMVLGSSASIPLLMLTSGTERARITSGGSFLLGTTTERESRLVIEASGQSPTYGMTSNMTASSGTRYHVIFRESGTERGSITSDGSITSYNTSSDIRLKDNVEDANEAGAKIDAIKVRQFDWKESKEHVDYGFIAQELNDVAPSAVTRPDSEENMWSVDYSKLVPMLVKEIQSLRARVAQLEAK